MQEGNRHAIFAALAANLGLAIAKFVGWGLTGAASMLAEGVHSVADTGNQVLLLWGAASARRPASESHPFGYARERYFWSFVVALVIFSLGSLFAIYEGIHKLVDPHELEDPGIALAILAVGVVLEGVSFRTAFAAAGPQKGRQSWWSYIRRTKNPELPVVLLEDLGALCGLAIAVGGVGLALATGEPRFDAMGSIGIGVLLGIIALVLAGEMKSLLIGEAASREDRAAIREALLGTDGVRRLIHLRTQHFGPDQLLVAAKVDFDESLSFTALSRRIDEAERRIRARVPQAKLIYIEPDVTRGEETGPEPLAVEPEP